MDAVWFAPGPYDVNRDEELFDTKMQFHCEKDWNSLYNYTVYSISPRNFPIAYYQGPKISVLAFGGFSSNIEFALQIEQVLRYYIGPYFLELTPLYETTGVPLFSFLTPRCLSFGLLFSGSFSQFERIVTNVDNLVDQLTPCTLR